ncbi:MAG: rfbF [Gemmatimonadetes bacterium]|jgi:glucose-1-phosphate cytidylyltransferase|nr:rfbF [Gemmatimonadota bacterium]
MKVVILAGGLGSRLSEETDVRPKPMVEIGGKPILWHIMKIYSSYGLNDFVVCLGYKGYLIKEYFANYYLHMSDVTIDLKENRLETHMNSAEPWRVTLVETGEQTMTGGRLRRVRRYLGDEDFCMTYGDGVSDVDVTRLIDYHRTQGRLATVTATTPPSRFGRLDIVDGVVQSFIEKPVGEAGWINGGFMVLNPSVLDYVTSDDMVWEREPLERLAREGQLSAFQHAGFFQAMDTLRDKMLLEELWAARKAPWKVWR